MKQILRSLLLTIPLATLASLIFITTAKAQSKITPDKSLGAESSVVTPNVVINGLPSEQINGGATRGANLFHSFQEFNVDALRGAYFSNPAGIQNILTRVTGSNPSNIQGKLGVLGNANLFLINPNGIIFGPSSSLDLNGSFFASTANSLVFGNGFEFSATNPQAPPLLTVNIPIGLRFRDNPGSITTNQSVLQVPSGNTLTLVGGDVSLNGGGLTAAGGRVELGGLTAAGTVGLNVIGNNLSLSFPDLVPRANISLNRTNVSVTDRSQGSVAVTGHNIDILGGSRIFAGIGQGLTAVGSSPGDIDLNATGAVTINQASRLSNQIAMGATGNAGNINIKAGEISITNQDSSLPNQLDAALITEPMGIGHAGDVSLESNGSITLIGQSLNREDKVISTFSQFGALGGGNISLKAKGSISLDNAFLVSSSFGGDAGNVLLQGDESISIMNNSSLVAINFSQQGNSGNFTLRSNGPISLRASMVSSQIGSTDLTTAAVQGNGGNIDISGQSLSVTEGALVTSSSYTSGRAGNIQINAKEFVELSGRGQFPTRQGYRLDNFIYSSLTTSAEQEAQGRGGNISITTGTLRLSDGANIRADSKSAFSGGNGGNISIDANVIDLTGGGQIFTTASNGGNAGNITLTATDRIAISGTNPSFADTLKQVEDYEIAQGPLNDPPRSNADSISAAKSEIGSINPASGIFAVSSGSGNAGNIEATAPLIQLNQGTISADTQGGEGNIRLHSSDLVLNHGSNITTNATGSNIIGGNINIDTDVVALAGNSTISADSVDFRGGQVNINAQGVFRSSDSKITAKGVNSQLNGTVSINSPDVDPSRGLVKLPVNVVDPTTLIAQNPCQRGIASSFTITGRGGIPSNPNQILAGDTVRVDLVTPTSSTSNSPSTSVNLPSTTPTVKRLVPAQGWVFNDKGQVVLTAYDPTNTGSQRSWQEPASCAKR